MNFHRAKPATSNEKGNRRGAATRRSVQFTAGLGIARFVVLYGFPITQASAPVLDELLQFQVALLRSDTLMLKMC